MERGATKNGGRAEERPRLEWTDDGGATGQSMGASEITRGERGRKRERETVESRQGEAGPSGQPEPIRCVHPGARLDAAEGRRQAAAAHAACRCGCADCC